MRAYVTYLLNVSRIEDLTFSSAIRRFTNLESIQVPYGVRAQDSIPYFSPAQALACSSVPALAVLPYTPNSLLPWAYQGAVGSV